MTQYVGKRKCLRKKMWHETREIRSIRKRGHCTFNMVVRIR